MIRDISARSVMDNTGDLLRVTAQVTDPEHDGPRVKLDGWNRGDYAAVFYLSLDSARELAASLNAAACDAEIGTDR